MSGQAEIIDKVLQYFEDCGGLAPNGSTNIEDLFAVSGLSLLSSNVDEPSNAFSKVYREARTPTG